ncbi:clathrin light chain [Trichosporon asahii var. asahii CBS 8904]|uniref:Clathrin light chain n=1 Tax=Trichosporon asahii var. asahii (strain CBS 8904) TaxID=1220162 RepID=K1W161_TRIAC|nr:clathrin light chain [Trichosporon asahii var. asahii CBS 8904]
MSDDPTADFLAREKAILGDDAHLFASGDVPSQPSGIDAFPDISDSPALSNPASPEKKPSGIDAFPALEEETKTEVRVTGTQGLGEDPERENFEAQFPDISTEVPSAAPVFNALSPQPYGQSPYPPTEKPRTPVSILPAPQFQNTLPETEEDSEPIKEWKKRQAEEIAKRNEEDKKKRDEMANKAEKAIDQFYEDYNKEKEKNIRENKENEAKFVEKLKDDIAKGTAWERIAELIGLENSQSKTIRPTSAGSDLARMREILLSLKRDGDKAPGAAGY